MAKKKRNNGGKRRKVPVTMPKFGGDHGPATEAATAGSTIEAVPDDKNNMWRRVHVEVYTTLGLTMRQAQAAREIRDAFCNTQKSGGSAFARDKVDSSPRPDAVVAGQVAKQDRLNRAMAAVPSGIPRWIVEAICWHNTQPEELPPQWASVTAQFRVAMDLVANRLGY